MLGFLESLPCNFNYHNSINGERNVVQQVSRNRCRGEISICKTTIDIVVNNIFRCIYVHVNFYNPF